MKKYLTILFFLWITLCLSGCGKETGTKKQVTASEALTIQRVDWSQGFQVGAVTEGEEYHFCDYRNMAGNYKGEGRFRSYSGGMGAKNAFHGMIDFELYETSEKRLYYVHEFTGSGEDKRMTMISRDDWSTQDGMVYFGEGESSWFFMTYPQSDVESVEETPEHIYVVTTDKEGNKTKETDIYPELDALGGACHPVGLWVDNAGRFYTLQKEREILSVYVFDKDGEGICAYDKKSERDTICMPIRDNIGRLLLPVIDESKKVTQLLYLNEDNQWSELVTIEDEAIEHWYAMYENMIYYGASGKLIQWDVLTGKRESVLNLTENELSSPGNIEICFEDGKELYLRYSGKINADYIVRMTRETMNEKETLVVGATWNYDTLPIEIREAQFYARNNGVMSEVLKDEGGGQGTSRLLIDMVNGKGPDILLVSPKELVELRENGALLDLHEVISEEQIEAFMPQAVTAGTVDGVFCGLPDGFSLETMFVRSDAWDQDGWTLDDALALQRRLKERSVFETDATDMVVDWLSIGIIKDLEQRKSRFVDWEKGISRFEEEGFDKYLDEIRLLGRGINREQSKFYGDLTQVMEEEVFAIERGEGPYGYISLMDNYKGELRALGYPAEDRKGNYLTVGNLLVVNAKVSREKKEIIRGYIEHLLSPGVQLEISSSRVNIINGFFCEHVSFDEKTKKYFWEYQGMQNELHVEKLYVDEYKEILENATVATGERDIINILSEELGPYLNGDRTALEVTRKIDNRIQLYLDEKH